MSWAVRRAGPGRTGTRCRGPCCPPRLGAQHPAVGVQVVRSNPVVVAEVRGHVGQVVQVHHAGAGDERQQMRRRTGISEPRPAELPQQLQVVLPGAAHRADDLRDAGGIHREDAAQPALHRQQVHDVRAGQVVQRRRVHDVVDLHHEHPAEGLDRLAGERGDQLRGTASGEGLTGRCARCATESGGCATGTARCRAAGWLPDRSSTPSPAATTAVPAPANAIFRCARTAALTCRTGRRRRTTGTTRCHAPGRPPDTSNTNSTPSAASTTAVTAPANAIFQRRCMLRRPFLKGGS